MIIDEYVFITYNIIRLVEIDKISLPLTDTYLEHRIIHFKKVNSKWKIKHMNKVTLQWFDGLRKLHLIMCDYGMVTTVLGLVEFRFRLVGILIFINEGLLIQKGENIRLHELINLLFWFAMVTFATV